MTNAKQKILIVDDDEFLLDMYATKFRQDGFDVEVASGGGDAIEKIKAGLKPHLMMLDVVMPGMDGFQTLEKIKNENLLPDSKIIVLSNLGQKEDITRGTSLGACDYIVKAYFTPSEVVKKASEVLNKK
ncbi:response regulator [Candidatus Parcubacteria bacterium]|nr:MAG: response regulator [Candidatus Parcubacteria bacterium]